MGATRRRVRRRRAAGRDEKNREGWRQTQEGAAESMKTKLKRATTKPGDPVQSLTQELSNGQRRVLSTWHTTQLRRPWMRFQVHLSA